MILNGKLLFKVVDQISKTFMTSVTPTGYKNNELRSKDNSCLHKYLMIYIKIACVTYIYYKVSLFIMCMYVPLTSCSE